MKKAISIACIIVFAIITLTAVACSPVKNVSFFVRGTIVGEVDFSAVTVMVNEVEKDVTIKEDGSFEITNLKKGDVVSFYLQGYTADEITIDKVSLTGIMVAFSILTFDISVAYDDALGDVTGAGEYKYGEEVTLTFTAAEHCVFSSLTEDDEAVQLSNRELIFSAVEDRSFTADFAKIIYPISFTKNLEGATTTVTEGAEFGGTVTLDAVDDDDYVFSKWIVNGTEIEDKHYEFALSDESTEVEALFYRRLPTPVLAKDGNLISWETVDNAQGYVISIDGVPTDKFSGCEIDLTKVGLFSGEHIICVKSVAEGYGNSYGAEITVQYVRPQDTPKNSGIVRKDGKVYYSFSRVLGAVGYEVELNGVYKALSEFDFEEKTDDILIDLSTVLTKAGRYTFRVVALGNTSAANSVPTPVSEYFYVPTLTAPAVTLDGDVVSWSHDDTSVTFDVTVAGITVRSGVAAGTLNLSDIVEESPVEVKVIAKKSGYTDSVYTTTYNK